MMTDEHQIFGDWRDLRRAIESHDPTWGARSNDERGKLWDFVKATLDNYAPMKRRCIGCKGVFYFDRIYRCFDCHAPLCGDCIKPHCEGSGHE